MQRARFGYPALAPGLNPLSRGECSPFFFDNRRPLMVSIPSRAGNAAPNAFLLSIHDNVSIPSRAGNAALEQAYTNHLENVSIPSRAGNAAACSSAHISQGQKPAFALTSVKFDQSRRNLHIKVTQYHNKHKLTRALTSRGFRENHRLAQTALSEGRFRIKCGMTVSG